MLKTGLIIALLTFAWGAAQAQQPKGAPEVMLTGEDKAIVQQSLDKLSVFLKTVNDQETAARLITINHELAFSTGPLDLRSVPIVGMALSRNSKDPAACALLKRIEPSAVCVK